MSSERSAPFPSGEDHHALVPASPQKSYPPISPGVAASEPGAGAGGDDAGRQSMSALRRRPPSQQPPARRHSGGEYERMSRDESFDLPSVSVGAPNYASPRRDEYSPNHPDAYRSSRPPRSYRNPEAAKPEFLETREDVLSVRGSEARWGGRARDLERGDGVYGEYGGRGGGGVRRSREESVDGYNYEAHRRVRPRFEYEGEGPGGMSREEREMMLRLPWTAWMNSSIKNRKFCRSCSLTPALLLLLLSLSFPPKRRCGLAVESPPTHPTQHSTAQHIH